MSQAVLALCLSNIVLGQDVAEKEVPDMTEDEKSLQIVALQARNPPIYTPIPPASAPLLATISASFVLCRPFPFNLALIIQISCAKLFLLLFGIVSEKAASMSRPDFQLASCRRCMLSRALLRKIQRVMSLQLLILS